MSDKAPSSNLGARAAQLHRWTAQMRAALLGLGMILMSCAAMPSHQITTKEVQAVTSAEAFISRHGYTSKGHPKDLPVEDVEVMDGLATPEELIERRRNTLEPIAFGVTPCVCEADAYYVFFYRINHADGFRGVQPSR